MDQSCTYWWMHANANAHIWWPNCPNLHSFGWSENRRCPDMTVFKQGNDDAAMDYGMLPYFSDIFLWVVGFSWSQFISSVCDILQDLPNVYNGLSHRQIAGVWGFHVSWPPLTSQASSRERRARELESSRARALGPPGKTHGVDRLGISHDCLRVYWFKESRDISDISDIHGYTESLISSLSMSLPPIFKPKYEVGYESGVPSLNIKSRAPFSSIWGFPEIGVPPVIVHL